MSPTVLPTTTRQAGIRGVHVLLALAAFFGVVFAMNGLLVYKAVTTHSGLVAQEPYRKGLAYNQRIEADERQQTTGWTDTVTLSPSGRLEVIVRDRLGAPVSGLVVAAILGRPSTVRHDVRTTLAETVPGTYVADAGPTEPGAWLVALEAREPGSPVASADPAYRSKRRLWLKP